MVNDTLFTRKSIMSMFHYSDCFFTSSSVHGRDKFMDMVNCSFGSGGMTCGLDMNVLPSFIQYLKRQHEGSRLPTKAAIIHAARKKL